MLQSKFLQIGDLKIHYLISGVGKEETIFLLHGWPTSSYLWRCVMRNLPNYQVIAIDLPGFGDSDKRINDSFSFRYYSRIIDGFLDQLKIPAVTLGVHDLGGPLGLYWMVNNMEKVDRLLLFNTLVYPKFSFAVKLFGLASVLPGIRKLLTSPAGIKRAMYFGVCQQSKLTPEIIAKYQAPFEDDNARAVLLKSVQRLSIKGFKEISGQLKTFTGKVLIIYGEQDRILPKVANTMEKVKQDLPQSIIIKLPNCGHFIQEEEPKKISAAISSFMSAK